MTCASTSQCSNNTGNVTVDTSNKPGQCPVVRVINRGNHRVRCKTSCGSDMSCKDDLKCCKNRCGGLECTKPKGKCTSSLQLCSYHNNQLRKKNIKYS